MTNTPAFMLADPSKPPRVFLILLSIPSFLNRLA